MNKKDKEILNNMITDFEEELREINIDMGNVVTLEMKEQYVDKYQSYEANIAIYDTVRDEIKDLFIPLRKKASLIKDIYKYSENSEILYVNDTESWFHDIKDYAMIAFSEEILELIEDINKIMQKRYVLKEETEYYPTIQTKEYQEKYSVSSIKQIDNRYHIPKVWTMPTKGGYVINYDISPREIWNLQTEHHYEILEQFPFEEFTTVRELLKQGATNHIFNSGRNINKETGELGYTKITNKDIDNFIDKVEDELWSRIQEDCGSKLWGSSYAPIEPSHPEEYIGMAACEYCGQGGTPEWENGYMRALWDVKRKLLNKEKEV